MVGRSFAGLGAHCRGLRQSSFFLADILMAGGSPESKGPPTEAGPVSPSPQAADAPSVTDHSLLRRLRSGNQDAATQLYCRYAHRIRALVKKRVSEQLARRVEPDDIVQSVFRRFFRRVSQGDYDIPAGEELWGLFLVIALNRVRAAESFHRAGKRDVRRVAESDDLAQRPDAVVDGDDAASLSVLQMTIEEALQRMPEHHRQILDLRIQGHEVAELAKMVGRSKRTVERNLQEIRSWLRSLLEPDNADAPGTS